jgi:hypothetical protein
VRCSVRVSTRCNRLLSPTTPTTRFAVDHGHPLIPRSERSAAKAYTDVSGVNGDDLGHHHFIGRGAASPLLINVMRKLVSPRGAEPKRQATASRKPRAQQQCLHQELAGRHAFC